MLNAPVSPVPPVVETALHPILTPLEEHLHDQHRANPRSQLAHPDDHVPPVVG
jgi:hypothetical protein